MSTVSPRSPLDTRITAEALGSPRFRREYALQYAYVAGAMYKGIASKELVVALANAGMLGFLGTGGMSLQEVDSDLRFIRRNLDQKTFGANFLHSPDEPEMEERLCDLLLSHNVRLVEAAAFIRLTPSLIRYRVTDCAKALATGRVPNRILAKVSRPEVASAFMRPPAEEVLRELVQSRKISEADANAAATLPMADDICVESDSGGHTDQGVALALVPTMLSLRDEMMAQYRYAVPLRMGAAGGIGTPHAAAAAFIMGADFIVTGSINQCTVEAGTSDAVKDLLQELDPNDTTYAPAGDMFEIGAKVQVVKRGVFFPARANKLYELYMRHSSVEEIDAVTRNQIEERYFGRSFDEVWHETREYYSRRNPKKLLEAERSKKQKMSLIFRWYFVHSGRLAMRGELAQKINFQIHCGPAMGAFNRWVKGSDLKLWRNRHVADIGSRIMDGAAQLLNERFRELSVGAEIHSSTLTQGAS